MEINMFIVCLLSSLFPLDIMSSRGGQQSQALAKPTFSEAQASALVESVFGFTVSRIQPLPSYDDQNFHVCVSRTGDAADGPTEYVLKISNTEASRTPHLIEVQSHVIVFLREAGFPTASLCLTKGGNVTALVSVGKRLPRVPHCRAKCMTASWLQVDVARTGVSPHRFYLLAMGGSHHVPRVAPGAQMQTWLEPGCEVNSSA